MNKKGKDSSPWRLQLWSASAIISQTERKLNEDLNLQKHKPAK